MTQSQPDTKAQAKAPTPPQAASEPTVTAVGGAEVHMVDIPKDIYETAVEDNRQRTFVHDVLAARAGNEPPPYVPPPVPVAVAAQTKAEMEAGAKRSAEFAAAERSRRLITAAHKDDKWAGPKSEAVFRPHDFIPAQSKGQGYIKSTSQNIG